MSAAYGEIFSMSIINAWEKVCFLASKNSPLLWVSSNFYMEKISPTYK